MNLKEIEERTATLDSRQGVDFLFDLLRAYGIPKASVSRLRSGAYDKSDAPDEVLWRNKVYFQDTELEDGHLYAAIDSARKEERILEQRPRFLILTNANRLVAADLTAGDTLDIEHGDLSNHATFFLPWAGMEKTRIEEVNPADIKAAEKMARLYDEITRHNTIESAEQIHDLNVFFSRLLFCFFAEDTGVFESGSFTDAIGSYTRDSGEDLHLLLDDLFVVLDEPPDQREGAPAHLRDFGYVNGQLFERKIATPRFSAKARKVILDCGTLDWSQINPDIFGSMIQAVVHPSQREGLGMHYTSSENIMKVIRPLFLDELQEALAAADAVKKLDRFIDRLSKVQIFDPACGSGNFLIIAYKELRRLEHGALQRIAELDPSRAGLFKLSSIELDSFYGIEIDDFAHEIAILSLWLAKHQMNLEFEELFGAEIPLIPLKDAGNIVCGNATRVSWREVCPAAPETYICSNPPYLGSRNQSAEHKADLALHHRRYKSLDYVAAWVVQAARAIEEGEVLSAGLVTTSSIIQGDQVGLLWPEIIGEGVSIRFAHQPFRWTNDARGNAGVTCVVIGLSGTDKHKKKLYSDGRYRLVSNINPYLAEGGDTVVVRRGAPVSSELTPMTYGCLLNDKGHLVLGVDERERLLAECPTADRFIYPLVGSQELLQGKQRWCLMIDSADVDEARTCRSISERLDRVTAHRRASTEKSTRSLADTPNLFYFSCYREGSAMVVPAPSSERRDYIPIGFLSRRTVVTNANAVYNAEPWLFGLIQSRMHMVWVRAVAGRLKTDYRYSPVLVYNTFPVPALTDADKQALRTGAIGVLSAREQFAGHTLAELYDPDEMPGGLREAHRVLDEAVEGIYGKRPFDSDEERLQLLFEMYEAAIEGDADGDA